MVGMFGVMKYDLLGWFLVGFWLVFGWVFWQNQ